MDIEIRKYQVTRTGQNKYENRYIDVCRNCAGDGLVDSIVGFLQCQVCGGTGLVEVTKSIEIKINPLINIKNDREQ
jgi:DnaJ-class molecular chaperone